MSDTNPLDAALEGPKRKITMSKKDRSAILKALEQRVDSGQTEQPSLLSEKQRKFAFLIGREQMSQTAAYRMAFGPHNQAAQMASRLMKQPKIQEMIQAEYASWEKASSVTKLEVTEGFKEAIDMARLKGEPIAMIAGWREIARVHGHYAEIKHRVEHNHTGQVLVKAIQSMSDADLLAQIQGPGAEILEAEFQELTHQKPDNQTPQVSAGPDTIESPSQTTGTHDNDEPEPE